MPDSPRLRSFVNTIPIRVCFSKVVTCKALIMLIVHPLFSSNIVERVPKLTHSYLKVRMEIPSTHIWRLARQISGWQHKFRLTPRHTVCSHTFSPLGLSCRRLSPEQRLRDHPERYLQFGLRASEWLALIHHREWPSECWYAPHQVPAAMHTSRWLRWKKYETIKLT